MRSYQPIAYACSAVLTSMAACSVVNAPDDVVDPATSTAGAPAGTASGGSEGGTGGTSSGTGTGVGGAAGAGGAECDGPGDCDDDNDCTVDDCTAGHVCTHDGTGRLAPCDDGVQCTRGDHCAGDAAGTCHAGYGPFTIANLPITITGGTTGSSNLAFDLDGNLLVPVETGDLVSVNRTTGTVTTVAQNLGARPVSVVVDPSDGTIYLGKDTGEILAIDPSSGTSSAFADLGSGNDVNGLEIAPSSFGSLGGDVVAVTNQTGGLYAIDPTHPTPVVIADQIGSDLAFSASGVLYVADWSNSLVVTVSATGTITTVTSAISDPEGIQVDDANNRLLVASASTDTLYQVALPGGAVSTLMSLDCRSGFWPCGMAPDGFGRVLIASGESNLTILSYTMASDPCVP